MKRKGLVTAGLVAGLSVLSSMSAFAGQWIQEERGWWWQNDDGSYPVSTWKWIQNVPNLAEHEQIHFLSMLHLHLLYAHLW